MATKIHHPKGSMCAVCRYKNIDCKYMDFSKMPAMKKYKQPGDPTEFVIVKCSVFKKG